MSLGSLHQKWMKCLILCKLVQWNIILHPCRRHVSITKPCAAAFYVYSEQVHDRCTVCIYFSVILRFSSAEELYKAHIPVHSMCVAPSRLRSVTQLLPLNALRTLNASQWLGFHIHNRATRELTRRFCMRCVSVYKHHIWPLLVHL